MVVLDEQGKQEFDTATVKLANAVNNVLSGYNRVQVETALVTVTSFILQKMYGEWAGERFEQAVLAIDYEAVRQQN